MITPRASGEVSYTVWPWGDAGGTGRIRLPEGFIKGLSDLESEFDKLPIGLPDVPVSTITLDLARLNGDGDLEDLQDYFLDPSRIVSGEFELYPGFYRDVERSNVFTLLSDRGDSSLAAADFLVEFEGEQIVGEEIPLDIDEKNQTCLISVEVEHIGKRLFALMTPEDLSIHMLENPYDTEGPFKYLANLVWFSSASGSAKAYGHFYAAGDQHTLYSLRLILVGFETLADRMYQILVRESGAVFHFEYNPADGSIVEDWRGPYDMVRFRKQNYLPNGEKSISIPVTQYLCGTVASSSAPDEYYDGFLVDNGTNEDTVFAYETLYDALRDMTEGVLSCGRWIPAGMFYLRLPFGPTASKYRGYGAEESLPVSAADLKSKATPILGAGVLPGVRASVPNVSGSSDPGSIKYRRRGTGEDNFRTLVFPVHNMPCKGDIEEVYPLFWIEEYFDGSIHDDKCFFVVSPAFPMSTLYYLDTPDNGGGVTFEQDIPIRLHHWTEIQTLEAVFSADSEILNGVTLPTPTISEVSVLGATVFLTDFWYPLRTAISRMQAEASLPFAAALRLSLVWGNTGGTSYESKADYWRAGVDKLGLRASSAWTDGSVVSEVIPGLDNLPGRPILLKTSLSLQSEEATITLIAPGA